MILLLVDSILLVFVTLSLGILTTKGLSILFRSRVDADLLELFLLGLMTCSFFFNLLSFFIPVDYRTLLLPMSLSLLTTIFYPNDLRRIRHSIRKNLRLFFSPRNWPLTVTIGIVLLGYWILPCSTQDSTLYHFESILWYEKYKVVPGLVNLNARLAFNPASFLVQSAFAFTAPVGQSLYPLNGVAAMFVFAWLLLRLLRSGDSPGALLYAALIVLTYRHFLMDISSPSSDGLATICMLYALVRLVETSLAGEKGLPAYIAPALIILYAVTVKASSFALFLLIPYIFFRLPRKDKRIGHLFSLSFLGLLIYLPWLGRNYILSGYLVFPFPFADWFHPDWKAPSDLIRLEANLIHLGPKTDRFSPEALAKFRSTNSWILGWITSSLYERTFDMLLFLLAALSPLYWLIRMFVRTEVAPLFLLWLVIYAANWLWVESSPVFRYGMVYVCMSFMTPAFDGCYSLWRNPVMKTGQQPDRRYRSLALLALIPAGIFYLVTGFHRNTTYRFTLADCWLNPLKSIWYDKREQKDFPYKKLKNGTRIYMGNSTHDCISLDTCLTCSPFDYGEIEMRGPDLDQGFRNVRDEVKLHYPVFVQ
jgi:hypothetical protein